MSDASRIARIKKLFEGNPDLLWYIFTPESISHNSAAADADTLWDRFGACSSGEKVLLRAALDIWFDGWDRKNFLCAIDLRCLDDHNLQRFVRAYLLGEE